MQRILNDSLARLFEGLGLPAPYQWQQQAHEALLAGEIPAQLKVPTAAGKTMIIAIWLAALSEQARCGRVTLPRRMAIAVNRRALVDDATGLCERLHRLIAADALPQIRNALASLSATHVPLAVSTPRGEFADNGAWSLDPSTPAIILCTPDMLGSRLLFRGYGVGRSRSATHAGQLGVDTLVVHDRPARSPLARHLWHVTADRPAYEPPPSWSSCVLHSPLRGRLR